MPKLLEGVMFHDRNGEARRIPSRVADVFSEKAFRWSMTLYVLMREKNGKVKMIAETHSIKTPVPHGDLINYFVDEHLALMDSVQHRDLIITPAWIASINDQSPSNAMAYKMFSGLGTFQHMLAGWEAEELELTQQNVANG
ncbi:hypothetical protein ACPV5S_15485 [Vibrio astriarenae]